MSDVSNSKGIRQQLKVLEICCDNNNFCKYNKMQNGDVYKEKRSNYIKLFTHVLGRYDSMKRLEVSFDSKLSFSGLYSHSTTVKLAIIFNSLKIDELPYIDHLL